MGGLTPDQEGLLSSLEADLSVQLAAKPKRLAHSLSVARCAGRLADLYGVDPFDARVAGTLHDWEKAAPTEDLLRRAREEGIDFGVDLALVAPLVHGVLAARTLPERYPWLSAGVLHAIEVHTTAAPQMSPLDMVVFVADGIEPLRKAVPAIARQRELVGKVPLEDLFWTSFVDGIHYVLSTDRYLYPGTIQTYNALLEGRAKHKER